jgi:hypothetical protein
MTGIEDMIRIADRTGTADRTEVVVPKVPEVMQVPEVPEEDIR